MDSVPVERITVTLEWIVLLWSGSGPCGVDWAPVEWISSCGVDHSYCGVDRVPVEWISYCRVDRVPVEWITATVEWIWSL